MLECLRKGLEIYFAEDYGAAFDMLFLGTNTRVNMKKVHDHVQYNNFLIENPFIVLFYAL